MRGTAGITKRVLFPVFTGTSLLAGVWGTSKIEPVVFIRKGIKK